MIVLRLPFPVSQNAIWRSSRGRVHKSTAYTRWIGAANSAYLMQKRELGRPIKGPFSVQIVLDRKKRGRKDLDNHAKVVIDHAQRLGLIENDKLAEEISIRWDDLTDCGCLLYIFPAGKPVAGTFEPIGHAAVRALEGIAADLGKPNAA